MIIKVKAYPCSRREEVVRVSDNEYKVYLKKPPEENKANIELIKLLKKYFKKDYGKTNSNLRVGEIVPQSTVFPSPQNKSILLSYKSLQKCFYFPNPRHKSEGFGDVRILRGLTSRDKIIEVR